MKILIVDDDNTLRSVKEALPVEWQSDVVIVNDLKQANRSLPSDPPQLDVLNCSSLDREISSFCEELNHRFKDFSYIVLLSDGVAHSLPAAESTKTDTEASHQKMILKAIAKAIQNRRPETEIKSLSDKHEPLTGRQLEVLKLMAQGHSNQEIADEIGITTGTVKSHINQIFAKLSVTTRSKATVKAARLELLQP